MCEIYKYSTTGEEWFVSKLHSLETFPKQSN